MVATSSILETEFAPAERVPIEIVHRQAKDIEAMPLTPHILNSILNFVFILNSQRQIVFASENVTQLVPDRLMTEILGLRPGEALNCLHATEHAGGCGTTRFCAECGAVKAILASLAGYKNLQECRLTRVVNGRTEALDLLVYASPLKYHDETFSVFCVSDISHQKRRQALERIFFHDIVNSVGGLSGLVQQLKLDVPDSLKAEMELADATCQQLLEQILNQKDLALAENCELVVCPLETDAVGLINHVVHLLRNHKVAKERHLKVGPGVPALALVTDATMLQRALANLVKNALEASEPGQTVTLTCVAEGDKVRFAVNNPGVMSNSVELQVFNRSFSTKGPGRGLGTYSVKLLTERYLRGTVSFVSQPETGTTFFITLPKTLEI
jgi:signal transduction histidine kinase